MNAQLSPKLHMSERSLSTVWAVVEWLDHHCGDDLVIVFFVAVFSGLSPAAAEMKFLVKAKQLELYGVEMHSVEVGYE